MTWQLQVVSSVAEVGANNIVLRQWQEGPAIGQLLFFNK